MTVLQRTLLGHGFCVVACVLGCSPSRTRPTEHASMDAGAPASSAAAPAVSASAAPDFISAGRVDPPGPMILIKGGRFRMGHDAFGYGGAEDEGPGHMVTLPSFRMDRTEVTIAAYRACVKAGACSPPRPSKEEDDNRCFQGVWSFPNVDDYPISCVTWHEAIAYCTWARKELPTEEMWEYAAAGAVGRDFPWGWGVPGRAWGAPADLDERIKGPYPRTHNDPVRVWRYTRPVGIAPRGATPEGLQDMAGNVSEWTASVFCRYDKPKCGSDLRVVRGGATTVNSGWANRNVWRRGRPPIRKDYKIGFRCVQRVKEGKAP